MAYTKTTWEDEILDGAERFEILDDLGAAVDNVTDLAQCQIKLKNTVTKAGTPVDADNLNHIEQGIEDISTGAALSVKGVAGDVAGDVADIQATINGYALRRFGSSLGFGQIVENGIADGAVSSFKIGSFAVTENKIGTGAVTESKIGEGAVTNPKIANFAINQAKIGSSAVIEEKIANGAVTEAKIGTGAVTPAKTSFMNTNSSSAGIYAGIVNASGTAVRLPSGWSVQRISDGYYRLTHNLATTAYVVMAVANSAVPRDVSVERNTNYADIYTGYHDGIGGIVRTNAAWDFILVKY